jgi:serine/threonine protein kinase
MRRILEGSIILSVIASESSNTLLLALTFLTQKGYVHRDISPGNIIFYEGRAKLSDLEFAKQYESGPANDVRTVSQPPPILSSSFDFSAVGYIRFHGGSWRIYQPRWSFIAQPFT